MELCDYSCVCMCVSDAHSRSPFDSAHPSLPGNLFAPGHMGMYYVIPHHIQHAAVSYYTSVSDVFN